MERWKVYYDLISKRRSIRRFTDQKVEPEKIEKMIEALRQAPSSSNSQPWHVVAVDDKKVIDKLAKAAVPGSRSIISWLAGAPLVFVLAVKKKMTHRIAGSFGHSNLWLDTGIGGQQLVLAAHALELGTCWIGWFSEKKVRDLTGLPVSYSVAALIPCGYPAEEPESRPRKERKEIYSLNRFGQV